MKQEKDYGIPWLFKTVDELDRTVGRLLLSHTILVVLFLLHIFWHVIR